MGVYLIFYLFNFFCFLNFLYSIGVFRKILFTFFTLLFFLFYFISGFSDFWYVTVTSRKRCGSWSLRGEGKPGGKLTSSAQVKKLKLKSKELESRRPRGPEQSDTLQTLFLLPLTPHVTTLLSRTLPLLLLQFQLLGTDRVLINGSAR